MTNCVFGFPNYADGGVLYTPVLSGGSWSSGLPLANLQDDKLSLVARSSDAAYASTQFDFDLITTRAIRALGLWKHNLSSAGAVRVRLFSSPPCFDSLTYGDASWTAVQTPTRSAAAFTCSDGVPLDLVGDDDGTNAEYWNKAVVFTGNGQKVLRLRIKKGTIIPAGGIEVTVQDTTAAANRLDITIDWSGTVPFAASSPTGSLVSVTALGDGSYILVFLTTSVTAGNNHDIDIRPAAVANQQGNVYVGDIVAFNAATDQLVYDSGFSAGWPAGLTAEQLYGINLGWRSIPSAAQSARYGRCNINDPANAAGYVQAARLIVAGGWQPTINLLQGASIEIEDFTRKSRNDGDAEVFDVRANRRVQRFSLEDLPESEMLQQGLDLQRLAATHQQILFAFDPSDTTHAHRRDMLCRLRRTSSFAYNYARYGAPWELEEVL